MGGAAPIPFFKLGHIGTALHFHQLNIDTDSLKGISATMGWIYDPIKYISIGYRHNLPIIMTWYSQDKINQRNLTAKHTIPAESSIGLAISLPKLVGVQLSFLSDFLIQKNETNDTPVRIGSSININKIALKAGYNIRYLSTGISIKLENFKINYSLTIPKESNDLSNRHGFGINYLF